MEINATTIAEWLDKMNKKVVKKLNDNCVARSKAWISFSSTYDAVNNQIEATYDNGCGDNIRVCYFGFKVASELSARAAVEAVTHKSARMNITNMRRHHFIDCDELAERDHVGEKKLYWYFREHAKEHAYYESKPWFYDANSDTWANFLCGGLERAFDVGERRQLKVGISDAEEVAQSDLKKRLDAARTTIELLDTTYSQLYSACHNNTNNTFDNVKAKYDTNAAKCYTNPYNNSTFAKIPCEIHVKLNKSKCVFSNANDVCESGLIITYNLTYDEQLDTVSVDDFTYAFGYYMSKASLTVNDHLNLSLNIERSLSQNLVFGCKEVTVSEFKTRVIDKVVARIDEALAIKASLTK